MLFLILLFLRFKDEVELKETDRLKILPVDSQTQILILTQVDEVDLGTYECRAVNKAGSTSSKAKLNITSKCSIKELIFKVTFSLLL